MAIAVLAFLVSLSVNWRVSGVFDLEAAMAAGTTSFPVSSPLQLSLQPSLVLNRGMIIVDDANLTKPRRSTHNKTHSPRNLALLNGQFTLNSYAARNKAKVDKDTEQQDILVSLLRTLTKFGFDTLDISDSTLLIINAAGTGSTKITNIKARVKRGKSGLLSAKGSFNFRGEHIKFNASLNRTASKSAITLMPFSFELTGRLFTSSFQGRLSLASGSQIQGEMKVSSTDLRAVAKWLIDGFPDGPALKTFSAIGPINIIGKIFSFEDAKFELDGNIATGGLTLNLEQKRPLFEGTLATSTITLDPYFTVSEASGHALASSSTTLGEALSIKNNSANLYMPSLRYFDADLRISAQSIKLGELLTGNTAVAVSLRSGKLLADIAEVEFEGGRGIGQLTADMSGYKPRFAIRGKLDNTQISRLIGSILSEDALQGTGQLILKLQGRGKTLQQLGETVSGKAQLVMPEGGSISVDPRAMFDAANKSSFSGWSAVRDNTSMGSNHTRVL